MDPTRPPHPRVSRETRLLLLTILISISALWVLARIRFPGRPATNAVAPVFQLAPRPVFDELALTMVQLESRIAPALFPLELRPRPSPASAGPQDDVVPALRIRDDVAVALLESDDAGGAPRQPATAKILASNPASGLTVVQVPASAKPVLSQVLPQRMLYPRFVILSDVSRQGSSVRPVLIAALQAVDDPVWPAPLWTTSPRADLESGAFVFNTEGALAGLVTVHDGLPAIVPAEVFLGVAERLLAEGQTEAGDFGIDVQNLTPAIAAASGASGGIVVTWVDPAGASARKLAVMDVIEAVDDAALLSERHWRARIAHVGPGETLVVRVRRRGEILTVPLKAAVKRRDGVRPLGLTLRVVRRVGAEVLRVDPGSAGEEAGLQGGDVITAVGDLAAPGPEAIAALFDGAAQGTRLLVAITRGSAHQVVTLEKR